MYKHYKDIIYYATLAPSGHNTQPWKFELFDDGIVMMPDWQRTLPIADPDNHALFISLGCALENLVIAAKNLSYQPEINYIFGGRGFVQILLQPTNEAPLPEDILLFQQIPERQSTRCKYNNEPITQQQIDLLLAAANEERVECQFINDAATTQAVIELAKEACIVQYDNDAFVAELTHWIRFNKMKAGETNDGLYSKTSGNLNVPNWLGKILVDVTISPENEAKKYEALINSSSALVLFAGFGNSLRTWINVGRSFERFALKATALDLKHAHVNMPCEIFEVREKLANMLQLNSGTYPFLLIRLGYAPKMPHAYRRPVEEVIISHSEAIAAL
jgi:hypothetical protein